MLPLLSLSSPHSSNGFFFKQPRFPTNYHHPTKHKHLYPLSKTHHFSINSVENDATEAFVPEKSELRTLFPGGYKRAEIKVPNIVLQLDAAEVVGDSSMLDLIDTAVAKWVGIVVVNGDQGSGGKLYEAACLLKSIIRDRAYLLVAERVDVAAAINASGVLLSDQGLPPIVARNTLLSSKSDSVVLPVVGRIVQTVNAALNASSAEGADFLIYSALAEQPLDAILTSINKNVKIPVFFDIELITNGGTFDEVSMALASGVVISMEKLKFIGDGLSKYLYDPSITDERSQDEAVIIKELNMMNTTTSGLPGEKGMPSFVNLEAREVQFIRKEKRLLTEAIETIEKAAPLVNIYC